MNSQISISRNTARWIALSVGALALVVGLVSFFVLAPQSSSDAITTFKTIGYVGFGLGAAGIVGFVLLDPQSIAEAITGRSGQYTITSWLMAVFFTAFVVAIFVIIRAAAIPPLDLTQAQKYAMTDVTKKLLKDLKQDVHVVGFYGQGQDTDKSDAETWLRQYATVSNGRITYEFVDPDKEPGKAKQLGMTRSPGMIFKSGDQTAEAATATESDMSNALIQVLSGKKQVAYVLVGHGEIAVDDFNQTGLSQLQSLMQNSNFTVNTLNLTEKKTVPDDANVLIIAGPRSNFFPAEIDAINAFTDKGGGLAVMIDPQTLSADDPLIKDLHDKWGVSVMDDIVIDGVGQQLVGDPLSPVLQDFDSTSPISKDFQPAGKRLLMSQARSLQVVKPPVPKITLVALAMTINYPGASWGETHFDPAKPNVQFDPSQDNPGPLTLAMSAEDGGTKGRLVVFGDSDFADNGLIANDKYNGEFLLNTAGWLAHKDAQISLPSSSEVGTRGLTKLTSQTVITLIGIGTACVIPLAMLIAGVIVFVVRRRRR